VPEGLKVGDERLEGMKVFGCVDLKNKRSKKVWLRMKDWGESQKVGMKVDGLKVGSFEVGTSTSRSKVNGKRTWIWLSWTQTLVTCLGLKVG
jgi:hypothetical protein